MVASVRHLWRLVRIAFVLARHDALFPLELLGVAPGITLVARVIRRPGQGRPGQRLAAALQALGPSFIKLGQALSTRADLMGDQVAADLAGLRDRLPPFPGSVARATIATDLDRPVETLFQTFDDVPVAAASIAQVHFAVTAEGAPVAVKVLRPGIEAAFARDLALFSWMAALVERTVPASRRLKPREAVRTFAETVRLEMDLRFEAAAAAELAESFAGDPGFRVPAVDWARTGRRVLTTERVLGIPISDRAALLAAGHDLHAVMANAAGAFFQQVFRDGFFHGDMHPGNCFVAADGAVVAVDFGIMGRLDLATREFLADMLVGFLDGDYRRVADVHFAAGYVPPSQSRDAFMQACRSIGEPIFGRPLAEISLARLLGQLFAVTEQFEMEAQPQLLLLQKTMLVAEGVGRHLDPTINMWTLARPLVEAWMVEHRGPEARLRRGLDEALAMARRMPALLDAIEALGEAARTGVRLHPESLRARGADRLAQWALALAVVALAAALFALAG
ncbi:MAG: 2-polyprenylphenol 6-hydroxylase [Alphaproteobacteria bacterium]|nr:2-polyprenylphenol 6-hydroxylase [Alphaproteobacteria bacterium]